jgi:NADH-quinone oxidoreductase subunit L
VINTTLLSSMLALAPDTQAADASHAVASHAVTATEVGTGPKWILLIVGLPLLSSILSLVYAMIGNKTKLPAWTTVAAAGTAFIATVAMYLSFDGTPYTVHAFDWIQVHFGEKSMIANFSFYIDTLTIYWMLFVTGLATCIALYASEYMSHDIGTSYCRFFGAFGLFVFSMACLVMGDNFLMLYLGWEGVGLCSYLLIGYFYKKPEAVAAAKKAFIVNRIGDLGLALGIYLIFVHFGTLEYAVLFSDPKLLGYVDSAMTGNFAAIPAIAQWIPLLLMVGAFGKSAQFPLYVWLPDAMEGPTPVSALIHAATMVTAGVYLIARTYPLFLASENALPIVAWIGTITALLAATIGMAQFDIKRIMAYSTVSQLGYMFAGLGVLTPTGGAYHVLTHAFFKALLFLCCGAVMHGFAGQLDLRKLSGLRKVKGWGIVSFGMLVGCLNLAGFPMITAGYFSKDTILAEAFVTPGYSMIGWILLFTAGLTAYYTFRVFFRVFMGPVEYHPGDEHHDDDHAEDHGHAGDFHPHAPGWAINTVLLTLAVCSILAVGLYKVGGSEEKHTKHFADTMVTDSSASFHSNYGSHAFEYYEKDPEHYPVAGIGPRGTIEQPLEMPLVGGDPHKMMYYISGVIGVIGIALAWFLHLFGRTNAAECKMDPIARMFGPIPKWAENKWYVDEIYWAILVSPLRIGSHILHWIDKLLVDGIVNVFGFLPRLLAWILRPSQSGVLQGYAVSMAGGIALLLLTVFVIILQGGAS